MIFDRRISNFANGCGYGASLEWLAEMLLLETEADCELLPLNLPLAQAQIAQAVGENPSRQVAALDADKAAGQMANLEGSVLGVTA